MAWVLNGAWDGAHYGHMSSIAAQVCYAINERQEARGLTQTQWVTPGGIKTKPSASDFEGGLPGNVFGTSTTDKLIDQIKDAIIALGDYYCKHVRPYDAIGSQVAYYAATNGVYTPVHAASGYWERILYKNSVLPWLQFKSILEHMKYTWHENTSFSDRIVDTARVKAIGDEVSGPYSTLQDMLDAAWDDAVGNQTTESVSGSEFARHIAYINILGSKYGPSPTYYGDARCTYRLQSPTATWNAEAIKGTIKETRCRVDVDVNEGLSGWWPLDYLTEEANSIVFSWRGNTVTIGPETGTTDIWVTGWPTPGTRTTIGAMITPQSPSVGSPPFDDTEPSETYGDVRGELIVRAYYRVIADITNQLTYG